MFGEQKMKCAGAPLNQTLHFHSVWEERLWSPLFLVEVVCLKKKPFWCLKMGGEVWNAHPPNNTDYAQRPVKSPEAELMRNAGLQTGQAIPAVASAMKKSLE